MNNIKMPIMIPAIKSHLQMSVRFLFILILILNAHFLSGQLPDATTGTGEYYQLLLDNQDEENAIEFDSSMVGGKTTITIQVHIVNTIQGITVFSEQDFNVSLSLVNDYFSPAGLNFKLGEIDTVKEYPYGWIISNLGDAELLTKYARPNSINLFLVDSITLEDINYYGLTHLPDDTLHNNIYLRKDYNAAKPLITQLGHFFGLLSTYDYGYAREFVDGSNCQQAGDFICDTYADAGTIGIVNDFCEYIGNVSDSNGEYLVPSVANFMTNGPFPCRCVFSKDQYRRMYFYYKNYRNYLR